MYLFKNNKLVELIIEEDNDSIVTAIMTKEELIIAAGPYNKDYVQDQILALNNKTLFKHLPEYCFKIIQSGYNNPDGIGESFGTFISRGDAIDGMIRRGYTIYIDGIKHNNLKN